jgi:5-methylthioadenosine/S-adenosylhomocysteine deaminase
MQPMGSERLLLRGGHVVTLDPELGDIAGGDVLIEGSAIAKVGRSLDVADAEVIDASSFIVMPGLIDTHRHTWQTALRGQLDAGDYFRVVLEQLGPIYRPEDVYIGNLLGAVGALDTGVTTMLDWSHIMNSPAHADAAVEGLCHSGMRAVFAHGVGQTGRSAGASGPNSQEHSGDIRRLQEQFFSTDDQLVTLALAFGGVEFSSLEETVKDVALARELGIRMTTHVGVLPGIDAVTKMHGAGLLGPDITYVHASLCSDDEIKMIADSGGSISSSAALERLPGLTRWLKHGVRPSLSVDTEIVGPGDLFRQMRALLRHEALNERWKPDTIRVSNRDYLEFATVEGARALGLESKVGTLTPGKRADIVMLDRSDVTMLPPADDAATSVVLLANPKHVRWVLVDGKVRKRDGRLVDVDLERLARLALESREYVLKASGLSA